MSYANVRYGRTYASSVRPYVRMLEIIVLDCYAEDIKSINQLRYTKNSNPYVSDVRFTSPDATYACGKQTALTPGP